jgi:hypothetical protein
VEPESIAQRKPAHEPMAIATKRRRKLDVDGRLFVWFFASDDDSLDKVLHVASDDKAFIVIYHLRQRDEGRTLIVLGREFGGLPDAGGPWIRVACPKWEDGDVIGPGSVRRLIEWGLDPGKPIVRLQADGRPIVDL